MTLYGGNAVPSRAVGAIANNREGALNRWWSPIASAEWRGNWSLRWSGRETAPPFYGRRRVGLARGRRPDCGAWVGGAVYQPGFEAVTGCKGLARTCSDGCDCAHELRAIVVICRTAGRFCDIHVA
jgi:hypothetical protein